MALGSTHDLHKIKPGIQLAVFHDYRYNNYRENKCLLQYANEGGIGDETPNSITGLTWTGITATVAQRWEFKVIIQDLYFLARSPWPSWSGISWWPLHQDTVSKTSNQCGQAKTSRPETAGEVLQTKTFNLKGPNPHKLTESFLQTICVWNILLWIHKPQGTVVLPCPTFLSIHLTRQFSKRASIKATQTSKRLSVCIWH